MWWLENGRGLLYALGHLPEDTLTTAFYKMVAECQARDSADEAGRHLFVM